jgi:SAM-dependent methyltransferase
MALLSRLPPKAHILDLGCGGGQDALAMKQAGFQVTAVDGSPELAAQAERRLDQPVRVQLFEELDDIETFDAIWANASLLHVPRPALTGIVARMHRALKPGGWLYASFKTGGTEGHDALGRYYNRPSQDQLAKLLAHGWTEISFTIGSGSGYDGVATDWLAVTARKS